MSPLELGGDRGRRRRRCHERIKVVKVAARLLANEVVVLQAVVRRPRLRLIRHQQAARIRRPAKSNGAFWINLAYASSQLCLDGRL